MATTATTARANGQRAGERALPGGTRAPGRRRQLPLVVVGVLLVLGCALAFADASLHLGSREEVLVVAQPVAAGQVLTGGDLRAARVSTGSGLDVVRSGEEATILGRRAAVALVAGSLLTASEVGSAPPVGSGFDVVAVGLKAGAYPPELAPGDRVQVVPVTSSSSGGAGSAPVTTGSPVAATVVSIAAAPLGSGAPTVFSLQVSKADADEVASLAAAGQASLVELGAAS
ncbi:MAG: SAF domain-containing protein [Actinomycetota bacterium]|nr:SAF domain-containing protein [Actinomycetota bacterium]